MKLVILDRDGVINVDSDQFIKNPDAKITQTCFAVRAQHRVVLTGIHLLRTGAVQARRTNRWMGLCAWGR